MAPPLHASTPSSIANSHYKEARAVQLWHQPRKKTIIILQVDDELWSSRHHKMKKKNKNNN